MLSHELRGPTAVIQGYARLLGSGDVEPATAARVLTQVQAAASRIAAIGAQTSELARWLDPRAERVVGVIELRPMLERAVADCGAAAEVTEWSAPDAMSVRCLDPAALGSAVTAVLVSVSREIAPEAVQVAIGPCHDSHCDVTIGPAAHLHRRATWSESSGATPASLKQGGVGMSLVLAAAVLAAHDVHIWSPNDRPSLVSLRMPTVEAVA